MCNLDLCQETKDSSTLQGPTSWTQVSFLEMLYVQSTVGITNRHKYTTTCTIIIVEAMSLQSPSEPRIGLMKFLKAANLEEGGGAFTNRASFLTYPHFSFALS